jgi:hypothetical protein
VFDVTVHDLHFADVCWPDCSGAINTILGWPTITDFQIALCVTIPPCSFFSSVLNHTFDYSQSEALSGLPPGIAFDPELDFIRTVEPALPAKPTPPPSHRSAPTHSTVSLPSSLAHFDPSRQMKDLCRQMNAQTAAQNTASPPVSATSS